MVGFGIATARTKGVSELKKGWVTLLVIPLIQARVEASPRWITWSATSDWL